MTGVGGLRQRSHSCPATSTVSGFHPPQLFLDGVQMTVQQRERQQPHAAQTQTVNKASASDGPLCYDGNMVNENKLK